ncbi:MAG: hypothetical protein MOP51_1481 [Citricoccus sp.]|nr:hypothetical protein [Citricoccus sp. WCRC_4]
MVPPRTSPLDPDGRPVQRLEPGGNHLRHASTAAHDAGGSASTPRDAVLLQDGLEPAPAEQVRPDPPHHAIPVPANAHWASNRVRWAADGKSWRALPATRSAAPWSRLMASAGAVPVLSGSLPRTRAIAAGSGSTRTRPSTVPSSRHTVTRVGAGVGDPRRPRHSPGDGPAGTAPATAAWTRTCPGRDGPALPAGPDGPASGRSGPRRSRCGGAGGVQRSRRTSPAHAVWSGATAGTLSTACGQQPSGFRRPVRGIAAQDESSRR